MASLDRARVQAQIRDESIKPTSRRHAPPSPRPLTTPPPPPRSTSTPRPGANFSLRNKGSTFSFRTPSSKRKGRVFALEDADEIGERLQHMRKTSFGSSTTDRSVPRGRQPPRNSSALGFYLQDAEAERGRGSMSRTRAPSLRAPSVRAESVRSIARGRPSIDTRGRPSVDTKGRTEEHVPIERREYDRRRRKGKERALDW